MRTYFYKAKNGPGQAVEGELVAESRDAAVAKLGALGLSPTLVEDKRTMASDDPGPRRSRSRVTSTDITVFTRQLSSLTKSGVLILRSLATIRDQADSSGLAGMVEQIYSTVRDGRMLSEALRAFPRWFSDLYVNMVRAGEAGGVLDVVLAALADQREREDDMRRRVEAALAYPLLILAVGLGTVFVLLTFFLPKVAGLFKDFASLPLPTRILIQVSDFFSTYWLWLLALLLLAGAVLHRLAAMEKGRLFMDRLLLGIPLAGRLMAKADLARFGRTLSLLIGAGIPVERALELSAGSLKNTVLREEVMRVRDEAVRQGRSVSTGLRRSALFPPFVANMAAVGEESGNLDEAMREVAAYYEKDVEQSGRLMAGLLEPVLILIVGAVVGLIVAAMMMPVFSLSAGVR